MELIAKFKGNKKNGKRKDVTYYYCDFCNTSYSHGSKLLRDTGEIRYDVDYKDYGDEAVCKRCLEFMRGRG